MGTAFSSNESVTHSPNRNRANNSTSTNRQSTNRPPNESAQNPSNSLTQRRSSANLPRRHTGEIDDTLDVQIQQLFYGRSDNTRRPMILANHHPSSSRFMPHNQSRPLSFGGGLPAMGLGSENDADHERVSFSTRLPYMPYLAFQDKLCPICKKTVPYDNFETHYIICYTKPRVTFNEDILTENKGECVICLVDLLVGEVIARLPCLCIYHKNCIENWFQRSQTCPSHPDFIDSSR